MIKTVTFDLGNVIVFFSFPKMVAQLSFCTGLTPEQIHHLLIEKNLRELYESGQINSEQLYQSFKQVASKPFSREALFYAASDIFVPNTQIFPILESLKKKGTRLLLLSNTSEAHFHFLSPRLPILNLFDDKILSYQVKASKPDPKIFQAALAKTQCKPSECFYTDDIPEYVAAAKTHGIDAELFTDVSQLKKHLTSRHLL